MIGNSSRKDETLDRYAHNATPRATSVQPISDRLPFADAAAGWQTIRPDGIGHVHADAGVYGCARSVELVKEDIAQGTS
jgi:hypothetical protein